VNSAWEARDSDRAQKYSKRAKQGSIISIVTHVVTIAVMVGVYIIRMIILLYVNAPSSEFLDDSSYVQEAADNLPVYTELGLVQHNSSFNLFICLLLFICTPLLKLYFHNKENNIYQFLLSLVLMKRGRILT